MKNRQKMTKEQKQEMKAACKEYRSEVNGLAVIVNENPTLKVVSARFYVPGLKKWFRGKATCDDRDVYTPR